MIELVRKVNYWSDEDVFFLRFYVVKDNYYISFRTSFINKVKDLGLDYKDSYHEFNICVKNDDDIIKITENLLALVKDEVNYIENKQKIAELRTCNITIKE